MTYDEGDDFAEKRKYVADLQEMIRDAGIEGVSDWRCVEIGGEGGILAGLMADKVRHVLSTDLVPAQSSFGGAFLSVLQDKFERNGEKLPLDRIEFLTADAQDLPFRDDWFDFCFSQNAFEHIADPARALREAFRVTRPGGFIYMMFDPVWTADSGSHFLHYIGAPWQHLLADDEEIVATMEQAGASAEEVSSYRNHMNRFPVTYYLEIFPRLIEELGGQILIHHQWSGCQDPSDVDHPNRALAAEKIKLDQEALLIRGLRYFIQV